MSKERFDKTVAILVKAYLNDTLQHGNPCACAVGNMIASGLGISFTLKGTRKEWDSERWPEWFFSPRSERALAEYSSTGYTCEELQLIEHAFEKANCYDFHYDNDGYYGLMNVVSVLAEIDGISLEHTEEARKLFVK